MKPNLNVALKQAEASVASSHVIKPVEQNLPATKGNRVPKKTAIFIQTHFVNGYVQELYRKISAEAPEHHDVYILYNCGDAPLTLPTELEPLKDKVVLANNSKFLSMGYPQKCHPEGWDGTGWTLVPGNCDLNIVLFSLEHPDYDYYWAVEYDVHFEGDWGFFFERFAKSSSDLIGTTIYEANETAQKILNPPLKDAEGNLVNLDTAIRGFYPICRMSKAALELVVSEYKNGWDGHQEMLLGTILNNNGMTIEDIGGSGKYVSPENINAFYFNSLGTYSLSPGSFVFKPTFKTKDVPRKKNTLWHPVKPEGNYFKHADLHKNGPIRTFINTSIKPIISKICLKLWFLLIWKKQKDPK